LDGMAGCLNIVATNRRAQGTHPVSFLPPTTALTDLSLKRPNMQVDYANVDWPVS
jgi:hypothetical protein